MEDETFFVAGYTSSDVPYGFTIKKEEYIITDVEDDLHFNGDEFNGKRIFKTSLN